jgi:hypothetical protein
MYNTLTHLCLSWLNVTGLNDIELSCFIKHESSISLKPRAATEVHYLNHNYFKFETSYIFECVQRLV